MHSNSSTPRLRARVLSAFKLVSKPKELGISSSSYAANIQERSKPIITLSPVVFTPDLLDPLFNAVARSASISRNYDSQRSTKTPVRVAAGFPINQNFSQRLICVFEENEETRSNDLKSGHRVNQSNPSLGVDYPQLAMPEFPSPLLASPLLASRSDELDRYPSNSKATIDLDLQQQLSPPRKLLSNPTSTLLTPGLTLSTTSPTSTAPSHLITPTLTLTSTTDTNSTSGARLIVATPTSRTTSGTIPSSLTGSQYLIFPCPSTKVLKPRMDIGLVLRSPVEIPSPLRPVTGSARRGPGPEIFAGLDFLAKLCTQDDECESITDSIEC